MSEHAFEDALPSFELPSEEGLVQTAQASTGGTISPPATPLDGRVIWTAGAGTTPAKDGECAGAPQESIDPKSIAEHFVATDGATINLPAGAPVTKIIVVGDDVYLVQSDGKVIRIEDGASEGAKVLADGKDVLSGPLKDCGLGDDSQADNASSSSAQGSGGGVLQSFGDILPSFAISPLLPPTQLFEKPIKEYAIPGSSGNGTPPGVNGKPSAGETSLVSDDDDVKCKDCEHEYGEGGSDEGGKKCGNEDAFDDAPSNLTGILPHSFGPDGAGEISAAVMNGQTAPFTAGGEPVSYVWSPATDTLTAETLSGKIVFTLHVNPATGEYEFTQLLAVDHHTIVNVDNTEELNVNFALSYTVSDANGDTATGTLHVMIDDDTPTICYPQNGSVDEDFIKCGNGDADCTPGDQEGGATATGSLGIKWGGDCYDAANETGTINVVGDRDVAFKDTCIRASDCNGAPIEELTSCGVPLTYCLNEDGTELAAFAGETLIFKVTLSDDCDGSYTFELFGHLDHIPTAMVLEEGERAPASYDGEGSEGGHYGQSFEETITLEFCFVAHDSDLDQVEGSFKVSINDDAPYANGTTLCLTVDEDGLCGANADGARPGAEVDGGLKTEVCGSLRDLVSIGADKGATFAFICNATEQLECLGLTSNGCELKYHISGDTLIACAGEEQVFTLKLTPDGDVTFKLYENLDHPQHVSQDEGGSCSAAENTLSIDFSKLIQVSDCDGDTILLCDACWKDERQVDQVAEHDPAEGCFVIKVVDDVPVICTPENGRVDEDALCHGNDNDGEHGGTTACGDLGIKWGADDANNTEGECATADRSVTFCGEPQVTACGEEICLTSKGHEVTFEICDDGRTLIGTACGEAVFKVTLTDDGSGHYTFELLAQLDHPNGNYEDNLDLTFSFKATDGDGDCAKGSFVITVNDDSPIAKCDPICVSVYEDGLVASHDRDEDCSDKNQHLPTFQHGTLAALVSVGADCPPHFAFAHDAKEVLEHQDLKSDGECLSYCIEGNKLVATASGELVFTLTLCEDGSFTFCLEGNLDHPDACAADVIAIDFSKAIEVSDADGDKIRLCDLCDDEGKPLFRSRGEDEDDGEYGGNDDGPSGEGCFVVKVVDSVPVVSCERICVSVDEDDLATLKCNDHDSITGSLGTSPADGGNDGSLTLWNGGVMPAFEINISNLVSFGADVPGEFGIVIPKDTDHLKSKGKPITYEASDTNHDGLYDKLEAKAGDRLVFTLEVGVMTGIVLFTLFDQIDHAYAQGENSLSIDIGSFLTAIDSDGDHTCLAGSVEVKVIDDVPADLETQDAHLANKANSTAEFSLGSFGNIGADDDGKVVFVDDDNNSANNYLMGSDGQFITYNGQKITLSGYGGEKLIGKAGNTTVLEIKLEPDQCDQSDDVYSVKLLKQLDATGTQTYTFDDIPSGNNKIVTVENIGSSDVDLRITAFEGSSQKTVNVSGIGIGVGNQGVGEDEKLVFDFFKDANNNHALNSGEAFEVTQFSFSVTQNNPTNDKAAFVIFAYDKNGDKIELDVGDLTFNPGSAANPNVITVEADGKGLLVKGVNGGTGGLDAFDDLFTLTNLEGFSKITIEYDDASKANSFDVTLNKFSVEEPKTLAFDFGIQATDNDGDKSAVETVHVSLDGASQSASYLDDGSDDLFDDYAEDVPAGTDMWVFAASLPTPQPCACEEQVPMAA